MGGLRHGFLQGYPACGALWVSKTSECDPEGVVSVKATPKVANTKVPINGVPREVGLC